MSTRTDIVNLIVNVNGDKSKQQLNDLRKKAADLAFEMKGLAKNTQEYKDKSAELKKVEDQMSNLRKQMGLTALSQKELLSELRKLQALKNVTTPQTKEFFELQKQIDAVNSRLYEVKNGVFGFGAALHKVKDEIMKFGVLAVGYLGFEFITSQFKSIIQGSGKLEDKLADVQRVTGMTKDEVKALNKELKEIDTRTAQQQLLDYAVTAGKLGVATSEIKEFVKSTDMLVTALGDELGDATNITDNLGKIINVYDGAGKITGERTLQIGNAIVALANAGVASGGFIVDFTKRLGGLAGTAHIALESSVGMAAGLEELGQSAETSSTAISTVLVKIGTDLPKFAKLAGKDVKEFSNTLRNSPMEALIQLAEGLKKNKGGFDEIAAAFKEAEAAGGRVLSTLGAIGNNGEFLRSKMKDAGLALQDTSDITSAFALKNVTLGATIDKLGKEFNRMVTSPGVVNFLKGAVDGLVAFISWLKNLPEIIADNLKALAAFALAIVALNLSTFASLLGTAINGLIAYMQGARAAAAATAVFNAAVNALRMAMTFLVAAAAYMVVKIIEMGQEERKYAKALTESATKMRMTTEIRLKALDLMKDEMATVQVLIAKLNNYNTTQEQKEKILNQLKVSAKGYLNDLTLENLKTKEGVDLLDAYVKNLYKKVEAQAKEALLLEKMTRIEAIKAKHGISNTETNTIDDAKRAMNKQLGDENAWQAVKSIFGFDSERQQGLKDFKELNLLLADTAHLTDSIAKSALGGADGNQTTGGIAGGLSDAASSAAHAKHVADNNKWLEEERRLQEEIKKIKFELSQFDKNADEQERERIKQKYAKLMADAIGHASAVLQFTKLEKEELAQFEEKILRRIRIDAYNSEEDITRKQAEELLKRRKQLQDHMDKLADLDAKDQAARVTQIFGEKDDDDQAKKDKEKELEKRRESQKAAIEATYNAYVAYDSFRTAQENRQLERDLNSDEKRKQSWQRLLNGKRISQAQYAREIIKIDAESNKKKDEMAQKQLKRQKALAIISATINTIGGVVRAFKDYEWPYSLIVGAMMGAAGALQVANIVSQEVPTGRKGLIIDGPSHEGGGVDLVNNKTGERMANVEGGEPLLVLSKNTYKNNKQIIDDLFHSSQHRNGETIVPKWYSNSSAINMSTVLPALAKGGIAQLQSEMANGFSANKSDMSATNALLARIENRLASNTSSEIPEIRARVVLKDITDAQALYDLARKEGSLKQG